MLVKSYSSGSVCILAFIALVVAAPASAAPIDFTTVEYSDGAISNQGALIGALNAACAADDPEWACEEDPVDQSTHTVNGVPFTAIAASTANAGPVALNGGVSADIYSQENNSYQPAGPPENELTDVFFYSAGEGTGDLTFTGLSDGQQYELQLIMGDTRDHTHFIYGDRTDAGGAPSTFVEHGNSLSKIVTGTFTGDATGVQSLYVEVIPGYPGHFNAMQLRAVGIPEPSSLVVCSLGLLCLGVSGCRRKK